MSEVFGGSAQKSIHHFVVDLRQRRAGYYWPDMLVSVTIFWFMVCVVAFLPLNWPLSLLLFLLSTLALYRAALFVHEIGHFSNGTLPGFEAAWNALVGIPLLFPSFFIQSHPDHHRMASFGTAKDPEYLPFALASRRLRATFIFSSGLTPIFLLIRALLIVPMSWTWPHLRLWLRCHGSRMTMNNAYQPAPNSLKLSHWHELSEVLVTVAAWAWILTAFLQLMPLTIPINILVCTILANILNSWRTLHAHAYVSVGHATDFLGQLRDSRTFVLPTWLGELVAPVGQRFHAAHHLFPYLPYHALGLAHQRILTSSWAPREDYLQTCCSPSFYRRGLPNNGVGLHPHGDC